VTDLGFAIHTIMSPFILDKLFSGKIRIRLLARLFLNPAAQVYLRQLERELQVSSNTVRLELNKLAEMKLISTVVAEDGKIKKYEANTSHPLFINLRSIILKYVGVDHLIEEVFYQLGELDEVFLTGEIAEGKTAPFIDLVLVGNLDRIFLDQLLNRAERLLNKKIRIALYAPSEFDLSILDGIQYVSIFKNEMGGVNTKDD
jgi:predicted AAA+ superfamily ATPase